MPEVRYFGVTVTQADYDTTRSDAALGRFMAVAEPLPVGTELQIDGASHRVTRVEEGVSPGFWILPLGGHAAEAPAVVEAERTAPSPAPVEAATVEVAPPVEAAEAVPEPIAEQEVSAASEPSAPEPSAPEEGGKGKRKRKGKKTVTGR